MSDRVQVLKKGLASKLLALMEGKYDFEAVEEDVQQIYLADADEVVSFLVSQGLGWAEPLESLLLEYYPSLKGAVKFVPLEIGDDKIRKG